MTATGAQRKLPAYARGLMQCRARGVLPSAIAVYLGSDWDALGDVPRVCISPAEWRAGGYDLRACRDLHVMAIAGSGARDHQLGELICDLMRAQPALLWVGRSSDRWLSTDGSPVALYWLARDLAPTQPRQRVAAARRAYAVALARALARERAQWQAVSASADRALRHLAAGFRAEDRAKAVLRGGG